MSTSAEVGAAADMAALRRHLAEALRLRQDGGITDRSLIGIVRAHAAYDAEVDALRKALDRPTPDGVGLAAVAEIARLRGLVAALGSDADARRMGETAGRLRGALALPPQTTAAQIGIVLARVAGGWVAMQALLRDAALEWDVDELGLVESVRLLMLRLRAARTEIRRLSEALAVAADEASRLRGGRAHGR